MTPRPRPSAPRGPRRASQRSAGQRPAHRPATEGLGGEQVEGRRAVLELLRARRRPVQRILVADQQDPSEVLDEIEREAQRQRVPVSVVAMARLDREARTEGHQGVVAYAGRLPTTGLEKLIDDRAFLLVCDGVTDPRNLGAMLRSADGAGVTGVVLPRHRSARISPTVTKTAAGAIEYLDFCDVGGIPAALDQLNKAGVLTVGLAGESSTSLYDVDLGSTPVALVVGGEEKGLGSLARKRCAVIASIPQLGKISSLNAGVAYSIAAFEVARQRRLPR
ncbi:MAG: 23S rRNA (guanosine(2251)-2'-O)-methyltransferase RlmB [Acidobacteriota bacterium]|nr:23S rRNA (guanosine(2251)-2'-O)-methyltransferase RlmB [Acidobacteriota bacterium]MDE3083492.1 23S rRNA (guanosine(2251)-2'-O)-methyltransferase RlmB [Acidobacteriota bacterium]MDE3147817.1 23S rRNA (guanosine(2251)-2'-O)-methyltransferase RlmB [Acidobacteriota bacterium]